MQEMDPFRFRVYRIGKNHILTKYKTQLNLCDSYSEFAIKSKSYFESCNIPLGTKDNKSSNDFGFFDRYQPTDGYIRVWVPCSQYMRNPSSTTVIVATEKTYVTRSNHDHSHLLKATLISCRNLGEN